MNVAAPLVEDPSAVDDEPVRADRRRRLLDAMAAQDLDVLVLGRPAEVAFASGARQLWTAGSRPFGPASVVVRSTGHVHVLSISDFDVPEEIGHDDLYGLRWNPANLVAQLAAIPGLRAARRVGTTSSSPGVERLLGGLAPDAELVDGSAAVWQARLAKSDAEIQRILAACEIAQHALRAMQAALVPGTTERALRAVCLEALAAQGAPTAPTEGVVCATPSEGPVALRRVDRTDPIGAGQLVVLDPGGFFRGYEGGVGRTRVVGAAPSEAQRALLARARDAHDAVIATCTAGTTGGEVRDAWEATGEVLGDTPLLTGIGLGTEPPYVDRRLGDDSVLSPQTVLAVSSWVAEEGVGGVLLRDLVLVTGEDPRVLTADVPYGLDGGA